MPADNAAMEAEPITSGPPKRKRRWFQFSMRTLFVVMLLAGVRSNRRTSRHGMPLDRTLNPISGAIR
jgi:hypothetical protein